jgi:hypothetical protein
MYVMKRTCFVSLAAILVSHAMPAVAQNAKWVCSAPGLVSASYDGGQSAYVHLTGFNRGGTYPVEMNKAKTQATGTTANGTKFVCKKS